MRATALEISDRSCTSSRPSGVGTPASWNTLRPALLNPIGHSSGEVPLMGSPRCSATATSEAVTFHGSIMAGRPPTSSAIRARAAGLSSSAVATGPAARER